MMLIYFSSILFLAGFAEAGYQGRRQSAHGNGTTSLNSSPCAVVSQSAAAALASAATAVPTVDAQLAYECLTSVPINATDATALINSVLPFVEWQTDISYLKDPPSGYLSPPIDIWGSFNTILDNIETGVYANEHAFQTDLLMLFQSVHDGHFRFAPDLLSKAVQFRRPVSIVSVSIDGVEVPRVYVREDIIAYNSASGSLSPSPVVQVNGEAVNDFLDTFSQLGFLQDPDALYNNMFYEKAFDAQNLNQRYTGYFALAGRFGSFYPGPNTTIQFENGTINTYQNYAEVIGVFTGVVDGPSAYQQFCTGPHAYAASASSVVARQAATPPSLPPTATTTAYGYPTPTVISSDQQISGYFLDDEPGYEDVAVLAILSFDPSYAVEFQFVIQTFISDAKAVGKTKVIIDLSANGGGIILTGYDAFRQFFPQTTQDGFSRFREHNAFDIMAQQISEYSANFNISDATDDEVFAYESPLNYRYDLNFTNGSFPTYEDKFSPRVFNGDNFTEILRWNLDDPTATTSSVYGLGETITGYGDRANFTQPFAAEDIILVYDGYCASTCTLFSEFMRINGGVKSIAMGGRPNTSPIQGIGGTKGANNYPYGSIQQLANVALGTGNSSQIESWTAVTAYTTLPMARSTDNSVNVRDNILRDNLEDGVPAQFVYEAADCRLFYEPSMITDVRAIWKKAADAAWGGAKCVAGSLPQQNETSAVRRRKSEEMMLRAKSEGRMPVKKRDSDLVYTKAKSPIHGQQVPL